MVAETASAQTPGHCSAQPGWGLRTPYSWKADARTLPSASTTTVFVPRVPMSVPMRNVISIRVS